MYIYSLVTSTYAFVATIFSVSSHVWNIFRPCIVFIVSDLNTTFSRGFSTWIGFCNKLTLKHNYIIIIIYSNVYNLGQANQHNVATFPVCIYIHVQESELILNYFYKITINMTVQEALWYDTQRCIYLYLKREKQLLTMGGAPVASISLPTPLPLVSSMTV